MSLDVTNLQTFTDAELLKLYRWALANNAAGQTKEVNGRKVSFPPLSDLMRMVDWLEARVQQAAGLGAGGNIALAQLDDTR